MLVIAINEGMMPTDTVRVQIVVPAFNEEAVLPEFIAAFLSLRSTAFPGMDLRLLVVDDGSTDGTLHLLRDASERHRDCIGYISFAANAGHQAALIAGLLNARPDADVIVTMDADLEHPLDVVPRLVSAWCTSRPLVVHAIRQPSTDLPWTKRWPSRAFYRLAARLTGLALAPGQADFRLWDGGTLRAVREYLPTVGSLRLFAAWLPGRKASIEYRQAVRRERHTRFTLRKNYELAMISIVRFSQLPLRAITIIGVLGLAFCVAYGTYVVVASLRGLVVPGWSSTVLTVMTMGCLQLVSLGILASYLRRLVFARDLPLFVVMEGRFPTGTGDVAAD